MTSALRIAIGVSLLVCVLICGAPLGAATGGSISGTVKDQSDAVVPGASLTLVNLDLTTSYKASTDAQGFYSFPTLPVGRYELTIEATGFKTQKKTGLVVDADAAVRVNASLEVGERNESVTVSAVANQAQAQVETVATHLGEVVQEAQIYVLTVEWPQLYRPSRDSAGRKSRFHPDAYVGHHVRRDGND